LNLSIPDEYLDIKDRPIKELSFNEFDTKSFVENEVYVLFDVWPNVKNKKNYIQYIKLISQLVRK